MNHLTDGERDILAELNDDAREGANEDWCEPCECGLKSCGECESRYFHAWVEFRGAMKGGVA